MLKKMLGCGIKIFNIMKIIRLIGNRFWNIVVVIFLSSEVCFWVVFEGEVWFCFLVRRGILFLSFFVILDLYVGFVFCYLFNLKFFYRLFFINFDWWWNLEFEIIKRIDEKGRVKGWSLWIMMIILFYVCILKMLYVMYIFIKILCNKNWKVLRNFKK